MELENDFLPPSLQEIAQVIGLPAALKLVRAYGGTRVWVPKEVTAGHPLARVLGLPAARALAEYCALEHRWIPRAEAAVRAARNAEIRARRRAGAKVAELALEYGLTDRQVWSILRERPGPAPQIDLFNTGERAG